MNRTPLLPVPARATPSHIVGVGASAGGLAPLEQFLGALSPPTGVAFVVVQHLDPTHQTLLTELLQRTTALPVREATEGALVLPDTVYVIPPGRDLTVVHGLLRLLPPAQPRGRRLPIDALFTSLSLDLGDRAVGVVLSGMGADGTLGLKAIHEQGGMTLAQLPESAQFDAMPRHAIGSGCVECIDTPPRLAQHIQKAVRPPASATGPDLRAVATVAPGAPAEPPPPAEVLSSIIDRLRVHTRHDLSFYKSSTLLRRIERRVAVHRLPSMQAYADFLQGNTQELDLLFAEMLIGVTGFFRDEAVWTDGKDHVLPELLDRRRDSPELRAWVVGCSTGEEAYTLAMVFREVVEARADGTAWSLQVFATDLSAQAIVTARKGWYSKAALQHLTPERRDRFFSPHEGGWQVHKHIRDSVLFAQHDVIQDPPFTRLDVLSCRNVLIYFNAALQHRLLPLFHYSLRPGGVMLLGGSETVGRAQRLFRLHNPKTRWYERVEQPALSMGVDFPVHRRTQAPHPSDPAHEIGTTGPLNPTFSGASPAPTHSLLQGLRPALPLPMPASTSSSFNLQSLADHVLLQHYAPAAVLVNAAGDIVYTSGRTGRYLEPAAGKANWNIHVMARPDLRTRLAIALRQTLQDGHAVQVKSPPPGALQVTVQVLSEPLPLRGHVMMVFRELPPRRVRKKAGQPDATQAGVQLDLALELDRAREEADALRRDMQSSREQLQAVNEAMQTTNEELQSANEELTTSKEEAQSMNEELQTINSELQTKLDDLALAQSDMQNLLNSTHIATLFLDNDLNVRRFTEQAKGIFHLRDGDIGRPLSDLASALNYPELHHDARDALRTLASCERQVPAQDGRWFSARVMPYRTLSNLIQGVVLTFVDITVAKELESRLRKG